MEKLTREIVRGCRGRGVKILKHSTCATLNRRTMFSLPKNFRGGVYIYLHRAQTSGGQDRAGPDHEDQRRPTKAERKINAKKIIKK